MQVPTLGYKTGGIKASIPTYRYVIRAGNLFQHHDARIALRRPIGLKNLCQHNQFSL